MLMNAPVIGVPWPTRDYITALERAGAQVRVLTPETDPLPAALDGCDGVLLTGGVDVDPREYGEADRHPTVDIDAARDDYELALARLAMDRDLPLFAICRGVQVLNVAAGGTLIQDLPSAHPSAVAHAVSEPKNRIAHDVRIAPATKLAELVGDRAGQPEGLPVNSRHHQSVKEPAPGFVVAATADDGVIEAIEKAGAPFCLGVQWHPENFWQTGEFAELFAGLVNAARARSSSIEDRKRLDVRRVRE
jgi:putative glutamine amidotransferase